MQTFLLVAQVLISISLIALILLQHGKGADAGAAFGSGASSTVFGASGSASFLSRATGILATLFFAVSLSLSVMAYRQTEEQSLVEKYIAPTEQAVEKLEEAVTSTTDVPAAPTSDVPAAPGSDTPAVPAAPTAESQATAPAADSKPAPESKSAPESKKEQ
jgi:preprotein translocase subunit SecG